jgi:asparagine synthase (glutamine-hydrolysing)
MMKLARDQVTVALSGDGGDELFGGYNRYFWGVAIWRRVKRCPRPLRSLAAGLVTRVSPASWDELFRRVGKIVPRALRYNSPGDKLHKVATVLGAPKPSGLYHELLSHWSAPPSLVLDGREPMTFVTDPGMWLEGAEFPYCMMFLDLIAYLPDDILVKVDRAAMGVSLETRVPLLDHRLVEFAWRVPLSMKIRGMAGKWLLRQVLHRHVPQEIVERPKMGFGIPIDSWLRGPLREWAESSLSETRLRREGYMDPAPIRRRWSEHLSGRSNWQYPLWDILMFQAWLEQNGSLPAKQPGTAPPRDPVTTVFAEPHFAV